MNAKAPSTPYKDKQNPSGYAVVTKMQVDVVVDWTVTGAGVSVTTCVEVSSKVTVTTWTDVTCERERDVSSFCRGCGRKGD